MSAFDIGFSLDGTSVTHVVVAGTSLAELLGLYVGCGEGVCGSCTTLVNGVPVRSCLMLAVQADGCAIETVASLPAIEGTPSGQLIPLASVADIRETEGPAVINRESLERRVTPPNRRAASDPEEIR